MENILLNTTQEVSTQQTLVVDNFMGLPNELLPPAVWDLTASILIAIIAVWAREIVNHYNDKTTTGTNFKKMILMVIPAVLVGIIGSESSIFVGNDQYTWIVPALLGYSAVPILNVLTDYTVKIVTLLGEFAVNKLKSFVGHADVSQEVHQKTTVENTITSEHNNI